MTCTWRGKAYQAVPGHYAVPYEDFTNMECAKCGRGHLQWSVEPVGKTGYIACESPECDWWAEVY